MLNFLFGTDTAGKRKYVSEKINSLVDDGIKTVLIVPEQSAFERDREFLFQYGEQKSNSIKVTSFTHFSEDILEENSVPVKPRSDDAARNVLMSLAVRDAGDEINIYRRFAGRQECVNRLLLMYDSIKQSALTVEELSLAGQGLNGTLKQKVAETSLIFSLFESLLSERFSDPCDNLRVATEITAQSAKYSDTVFFFDGFRGFTGAQIKFLSVLASKCAECYVSITAHSFVDDSSNAAFEHALRNAEKIRREVGKYGVRCKELISDNINEIKSERCVLRDSLFADEGEKFVGKTEHTKIVRAPDMYAECEAAALEIKRFINSGIRCRDIAVFERGNAYSPMLINALKKYNIPVFEDKRRPFFDYPLVRLILSAVDAAANGFDTEKILACIKTGIYGLDEDECSEIENYVYCWGISYGKWEQDFIYNPDGFGSEFSDEAKEKLNTVNNLREKIISPLCALRERLKTGIPEKCCRGVYEFLKEINAADNFLEYARFLNDGGSESDAVECSRVWDNCMESLDSLNGALKDRTVTPVGFFTLLQLILCSQTVGDIPRGIDEILIGAADRMRFLSPKAVVVLGVNDGIFPRQSAESGLLTPKEMRILADNGFVLDGLPENKFAEERLIAFDALTCSDSELVLCYSDASRTGEKLAPSEIITEIKNIFPDIAECGIGDYPEDEFICTPRAAFERYAAAENKEDTFAVSMKEALSENGEYAGNIQALDRACSVAPISFSDTSLSRELFGENLRLSASQTETYNMCPFKYFCRYGMRVNPKQSAALDSRINGLLVHKVMEDMFGNFSKEEICSMTNDELRKNINTFADEFVKTNMGGIDTLTPRVIRDVDRSREDIDAIMHRFISEFGSCEFTTCNVELKIGGENCDIPAYRLSLENGGSITVTGSIDRVDMMTLADKKYVRIIDYKTGGKKFELKEVYDGLNMQMLIYLFALCKNGKNLYGDILPAGVLYVPAKIGGNLNNRNATEEEIQKERLKNGRMNGIILEDEKILRGMEAGANGIYIDAKIDKKTGEMKGNMLTLEEFAGLNERIDKILRETAVNIQQGIIPALPAKEEKCEGCDYAGVCLRKSGSPVKQLHDYDFETAKKMLTQEDESDGRE